MAPYCVIIMLLEQPHWVLGCKELPKASPWGLGTKIISRGTTFAMYRHSLEGVEANHMIMTLEKNLRHLSYADGLWAKMRHVVTCGITSSVPFSHFNPTDRKTHPWTSTRGVSSWCWDLKASISIQAASQSLRSESSNWTFSSSSALRKDQPTHLVPLSRKQGDLKP